MSEYIQYIIILLVIMGVLYGWRIYRQCKKSHPDELRKLVSIYAIVFLISIFLYVGITLINIPERMGWIEQTQPGIDIFNQQMLR